MKKFKTLEITADPVEMIKTPKWREVV